MIGKERWTDRAQARYLDYDTERAQAFGMDSDLVARPQWVPPVVPPSLSGQTRLRRHMMNYGMPVTDFLFDREWEAALVAWQALPSEFRAAWRAWQQNLVQNGASMTEEEYSQALKEEPKWTEYQESLASASPEP